MPASEATIQWDDSSLLVQVIPQNSIVTMDYQLDHVRVFVDKEGIIAGVP
jgi:hypothetical protein